MNMDEMFKSEQSMEHFELLHPNYATKLNIIPKMPDLLEKDIIVQERVGNKQAIRLLRSKGMDFKGGFLIRQFKHVELEQPAAETGNEEVEEFCQNEETREVSGCCCFIPDLGKPCVYILEFLSEFPNPHFISKRITSILKFIATFEKLIAPSLSSFAVSLSVHLLIFYNESKKNCNNGTICDFSNRIKQALDNEAFRNFVVVLKEYFLADQTDLDVYRKQLNEIKASLIPENSVTQVETPTMKFWVEFIMSSVPKMFRFQVRTSQFVADHQQEPFYLDRKGMTHFIEVYSLFKSSKVTTIPDFDKNSSNKLYHTDPLLGDTICYASIWKHIGEFEKFWPQFWKWFDKETTGLLLHGFSKKMLESILQASLGFDFEFDWLLFTQSKLFLFEVRCGCENNNFGKAISDKLNQVFTRHIPSMHIIMWHLMDHLRKTDKLSGLEENYFQNFFQERFSVIVFVVGVSTEFLKNSLAKVITNKTGLNFNFDEISNLSFQSIYFVGQDSNTSEASHFLRVWRDRNNKISVSEDQNSPIQTSRDDLAGPEQSTVQILAGMFALGYRIDRSENGHASTLDEKLLPQQRNYFGKLEKRNELDHNFIEISKFFSVVLSPQQFQILRSPEQRLILAGEPGTGKTILLLIKALDALWKKEVGDVYFCTPESKVELRKYVKGFTELEKQAEFFVEKFHFLSDLELFKLNDKCFSELQSSMLLVDEYYFDYEESFELQSDKFSHLRDRILPHLKYCWITDVVLRKESLYRHRKETVSKYFPVEMFTIKSLNVQFRSSCHIAQLCSKLHGTSRGFTGSRTSGVFISSQVECEINSFSDQANINLESLAEKFEKISRWAVVLCDQENKEGWKLYLDHKKIFGEIFTLSWQDGPVSCGFSGADVFSLALFLDTSSEKVKLSHDIIEEMYKLIISRAQYELCIFVHDSLKSEMELFLQCRNSELKKENDFGVLAKPGDDIPAIYKMVAGNDPKTSKQLKNAIKICGLFKSPEMYETFLEGKDNRTVFVLLGRKFGQEIIEFLISYANQMPTTSTGKSKKVKRMKTEGNRDKFMTTIKDIVIHALRINNKQVLEWIFRLIDFTNTKEAIHRDIWPQGKSTNLILIHSCFKPDLLQLVWDKLNAWGLLQKALGSKLYFWDEESSILPMLCYANSNISSTKMLKDVPKYLVTGKFCGRNALHHAIEHGNINSVQTLLSLEGGRDLWKEKLWHQNELLWPSSYAALLGHENIADRLRNF